MRRAAVFPTLDPAGRWVYTPECDACRWRGAGSHDLTTALGTAKRHNTEVHSSNAEITISADLTAFGRRSDAR